MPSKKVCDMDCLNCKQPDCVNDRVYSEKNRYCNRPEEQKEYQRQRSKRAYEKAKAEGLCIICKKKPPKHGLKCYECWLRQKRLDKKKNKGLLEQWKREEKCIRCGDERVSGYKLCEKHLSINMKLAENMLNHPNTIAAQHRWTAEFVFGERR